MTTITKLIEFLAALPDKKQEGIDFLIFHIIIDVMIIVFNGDNSSWAFISDL